MSTRTDFLTNIKQYLPTNPVCIEIGVLQGDFSRAILDTLHPSKLFLVDPWVIGYDKNASKTYTDNLGGLSTAYSTEEDFNYVKGRFKSELASRQIMISRNYSYDALETFPDQFFDFVYIDSCHLYQCVKNDLKMYLAKLKPTGLMCGHDYIDIHGFGVIQAVDEFIKDNNFKLITLSQDNDWALQKS